MPLIEPWYSFKSIQLLKDHSIHPVKLSLKW